MNVKLVQGLNRLITEKQEQQESIFSHGQTTYDAHVHDSL